MSGAPAVVAPAPGAAPEEELRAQFYRLLARFLSSPPRAADLAAGASLRGDASNLGRAVAAFAEACARSTPAAVDREFHELFIGLTRGELVPYGSYYLTGFLNEKPLAKLRQDMARFGIERKGGLGDPEDHIAALCEMMAAFIDGALGRTLTLVEQKGFFKHHIAAWAPVLFRDMEATATSLLYARLGTLGRAFLEVEEAAFAMV
jgi:TorA maturation chaperone TorD